MIGQFVTKGEAVAHAALYLIVGIGAGALTAIICLAHGG